MPLVRNVAAGVATFFTFYLAALQTTSVRSPAIASFWGAFSPPCADHDDGILSSRHVSATLLTHRSTTETGPSSSPLPTPKTVYQLGQEQDHQRKKPMQCIESKEFRSMPTSSPLTAFGPCPSPDRILR